MREMEKNHPFVLVLRIQPKFSWIPPMGVKYNHTKHEPEIKSGSRRQVSHLVALCFKICVK